MKNRKRFKSKIKIISRLCLVLAGLFVLLTGLEVRDFVKSNIDWKALVNKDEEDESEEEKPVQREEIIENAVRGNKHRCYTIKINELVISLKSKDEIIELLNAAKRKIDPEDKYQVVLGIDSEKQLNTITAYLTENQDAKELDMTCGDAGIARVMDEILEDAGESIAESQDAFEKARETAKQQADYNGTDANLELSIEAMEFADKVEIAVAYLSDDELMDLDSAIEIITKEEEKEQKYEVKPGDSLSQIALDLDIPMDKLVEMNESLEDTNSMIRAGDELTITVPEPELSFYYTKRFYYEENYDAETEYVDNDAWYTSDKKILQDPIAGYHRVIADVKMKNDQELSKDILKEQVVMEATAKIVERGTKIPPTYIKPISGGRQSSGFGRRSAPTKGASTYHKGIDWATPIGTSVVASCGGVVSRAGWGSGYGNLVVIEHPDGRQTRYGHLSKVLVKPGQKVNQGDKIALSGNTGRSTGPHLHFEILIGGSQVNPLNYMN